jgi:hypothetical protein
LDVIPYSLLVWVANLNIFTLKSKPEFVLPGDLIASDMGCPEPKVPELRIQPGSYFWLIDQTKNYQVDRAGLIFNGNETNATGCSGLPYKSKTCHVYGGPPFAVVTMRLTEREACRVALSIEQPECQINNYQIALIDSKSNAKLSSGF